MIVSGHAAGCSNTHLSIAVSAETAGCIIGAIFTYKVSCDTCAEVSTINCNSVHTWAVEKAGIDTSDTGCLMHCWKHCIGRWHKTHRHFCLHCWIVDGCTTWNKHWLYNVFFANSCVWIDEIWIADTTNFHCHIVFDIQADDTPRCCGKVQYLALYAYVVAYFKINCTAISCKATGVLESALVEYQSCHVFGNCIVGYAGHEHFYGVFTTVV